MTDSEKEYRKLYGSSRTLGPAVSFGAALAICLVILLIEMSFRTDGLAAAAASFNAAPKLWLLNVFPVLSVISCFIFIFGNVFYAGALTELLFTSLAYANLLKIEGRSDPLVPSDLTLIKEAADAAMDYGLDLHPEKILIILAGFILLIILGKHFKIKRTGKKRSLLCVILIGLLFALSVKFYYTDSNRYYRFKTPERYNVAKEFETLGFNYCFLYNWRLYPVDKPAGFDRKIQENALKDYPYKDYAGPKIKPHIIIVMGEAFSDLSNEEPFAYTAENDPLKGFKKAAASKNAVSGHIAVSNYAAGTANTEFNVMTGMQTNMIGKGLTSSFRVVRKPTENVYSLLKEQGYEGLFFHPGKPWFYNRQSVYKYFGIDDQIFEEAFSNSDKKGTMISDAAFLRRLKDALGAMMKGPSPIFVYGTTIENHQAYTYGKYDFAVPPAKLKPEAEEKISEASKERLAVYMEGIRDNSDMYLELSEWLDSIDEPAICVFFGDHRGNLLSTYEELGLINLTNKDLATPKSTIESYLTPFLVRANKTLAEKVDVPAAYKKAGMENGMSISDNYLLPMVLEAFGFERQGPYFDLLNELRKKLPIYRDNENAFLLAGGNYTDKIAPELAEKIKELHDWTYYKIKY